MKVLVATGASGGHIFPAVSFIDALETKHKGTDTLLVLPKRGIGSGILLADCKIKYISTSTITFSISTANFIAIVRFLKGTWESLMIILEFKPDIVVGFGSLDSIPCLLIAWLFRIKTLIHEQNVLPGRANRLLAHFCDRVAVSFVKTKDYLNINQKKIVVTGNPLLRQLKKIDRNTALDSFSLSKDKFTVLVMGGSQGSRHINSGFLNAVANLSDISMIQVIHLAGVGEVREVKEVYKNINLNHRVYDFLENMGEAYSASDIVISRAGATTIAELISFKLPGIVSPYPYAYAHQFENAKVLGDRGCVIIINDDQLEKEVFKITLETLINNRDKLESMRSGYSGLSMDGAANLLADAVLAL
ncbi:MAG: undecaprenyldiphospho-muramoylpentapeptide beta-N-acetylglucosaminyltransferase [Candidatus Omnitrophota bacterium]|nr:undecaprenyldiphospho-muramoylpentapeptide beta-N-acetylglucosaminyltransferase [Candidatus Omnitrophota bacterium]